MSNLKQSKAYTLFFEAIKAQKSDIVIITIYAVVIGLLYLILPLAVQELVSIVAFGVVVQPIIILSLLVMAILILVGFLQVIQRYIVEVIQQRLFVHNAFDIVTRIKSAYSHALNNKQINMFFEVLSLQKAFAKILVTGLGASLQAIVGLVILSFYHPLFILLTTFLLIGTLCSLFLGGRKAHTTSLVESQHKYELIHWLQEVGYCSDYFKLTKNNNLLFEKTDLINLKYVQARNQHFKILIRQFILTFAVQIIANGSLLALGGWLVIQGQLTLGQLIAAELMVTSIIAGIDKVVNQADVFYDLLTALTKIEYLKFSAREVKDGTQELSYQTAGLEIECRKVTFSHLSSDENHKNVHTDIKLFKNLNLKVPSGSWIAIFGGPNSGKRSLISLLIGLYQTTQGTIYLDQKEIKDLKISSIGESASVIKSDTNAIFEGTIAENILMGRQETIPIKKILEFTDLVSDLDLMPLGLKTPVISQGLNVSMSQVTKILIARALVSRPRLLLVNYETLTNLSNDTLIHNIFENIPELFGFKPTVIFFASHPLDPTIDRKIQQKYLLKDGALSDLN